MAEVLNLKDVLEEMVARELIPKNSDLYKKYLWLKNGEEGENECYEWLRSKIPYGAIYRNLEIEYNARTQIDLLVLSDAFWWVIEVKNYNGVFEYRDQRNELRGAPMHVDPIQSMRMRMRIVRDLAMSIDPRIKVEGSMIFIHPESEAIVDNIEEFQIVMRHQFNRHIEKKINDYPLNQTRMVSNYYQFLEKHFSPYPVTLPTITKDQWEHMKKGCRCNQCNSYNIVSNKKTIVCIDCGNKMYKTKLAQELYCQLCVLSHDKEKFITLSRIYEFCDNQISYNTLWKAVYPYIPVYNKSRYSHLHNYKLPSNKLNNIFPE